MSDDDRHAVCRFGMLTQAFTIKHGIERPALEMLCLWKPEVAPPALTKAWGGLTSVEECAACRCFQPLEPAL